MTLITELTQMLKGPRGRVQAAVGRLGLFSFQEDFPVSIRTVWLGGSEQGTRILRIRTGGELPEAEAIALGDDSGLHKWLWLKASDDYLIYCETPDEGERALGLFRKVAERVPGARIQESYGHEDLVNPLDYELLQAADDGGEGPEAECLVLFMGVSREEWTRVRAIRERFRDGLARFARLWEKKTGHPINDALLLQLQSFLRELEVVEVLDEPLEGVEPELRKAFHAEGQPDLHALLYRQPDGTRSLWAGFDDPVSSQ